MKLFKVTNLKDSLKNSESYYKILGTVFLVVIITLMLSCVILVLFFGAHLSERIKNLLVSLISIVGKKDSPLEAFIAIILLIESIIVLLIHLGAIFDNPFNSSFKINLVNLFRKRKTIDDVSLISELNDSIIVSLLIYFNFFSFLFILWSRFLFEENPNQFVSKIITFFLILIPLNSYVINLLMLDNKKGKSVIANLIFITFLFLTIFILIAKL